MPKQIPTIGDPNWGITLNAHLSQLQNPANGGINTFEQFSQRPTNLTADDVGKTYLYTQTGNIHQWNGNGWKVINESVINVKDYGAVGDGVTDDTGAIQSAVNLGKSCFFPEGRFLANGIELKSDCEYYGTGNKSNLILLQKSVDGNWTNFLIRFNSIQNSKIHSLKLTCPSSSVRNSPATEYTNTAILVESSSDCKIENIEISQFSGIAIWLYGNATTITKNIHILNIRTGNWFPAYDGSYPQIWCHIYTYDCLVQDCSLEGGTFGIGFYDAYDQNTIANAGVYNCKAINNTIKNFSRYGIVSYNTRTALFPNEINGHIITGNKIKNISGNSTSQLGRYAFGAGIYCVGGIDLLINSNYIEDTNQFSNESSLAPGCIGLANCKGNIIISNNICRKSGYYGIFVNGCYDGAVINGNTIEDTINESLIFLNCNQIVCTNNNIKVNARTIRTPFTILTVNNSIFSNNYINYNTTASQDATYISDSNFVNFSNNVITIPSSNTNNRVYNCDNLTFANNIYNIPNSTKEVIYFQTKTTNSKIMGNTFSNNTSIKLYFDGVCTNTFVDKSNRLALSNITNASTGLTIDV
jgi:Pectate lyase superfamily protein